MTSLLKILKPDLQTNIYQRTQQLNPLKNGKLQHPISYLITTTDQFFLFKSQTLKALLGYCDKYYYGMTDLNIKNIDLDNPSLNINSPDNVQEASIGTIKNQKEWRTYLIYLHKYTIFTDNPQQTISIPGRPRFVLFKVSKQKLAYLRWKGKKHQDDFTFYAGRTYDQQTAMFYYNEYNIYKILNNNALIMTNCGSDKNPF